MSNEMDSTQDAVDLADRVGIANVMGALKAMKPAANELQANALSAAISILAALPATPPAADTGEVERLREALEPFAKLANEWERWQARGSTSTPCMIQLVYGRCQIGLPEYRAALAALAPRDHGEAPNAR